MPRKNKIRRAVQGTCFVVETSGATSAEAMPSKVRVTVQRPRGGCLCLLKTSRQVAVFTFEEGPRTILSSHALLDLEKLFKYSKFEDTQVKICVEMQQGVRRVARVPLEEFLKQLLSTGPTDMFFLHIHESFVTLRPTCTSSPDYVPKWVFEGFEHKEDQMEGAEEACVVDNEAECPTEQATLPQPVMITGREEESCYDKEEELGTEWVTISLSDSDDEGQNCDKEQMWYDEPITYTDQWTENYYTMTDREAMVIYEPEKVAAGRRVFLYRLMISWHGAILIACFITLVAVFYDFLQDGDLFWQGALLVACYANLATSLLHSFEKED